MTSRSNSVLLAGLLLACSSAAEEPKRPTLPPPEAAKAAGKAMLTTRGFIHPDDPPGTWRARRPHGKLIEPCSDWIPNGPPLTDEYGKEPGGPKMIWMSLTMAPMPGFETLTESKLTALFGPPHPATKTVMIGNSAPLGRHWTWTLKGKPAAWLIAEARRGGAITWHSAEVGRFGGGAGNSAGFMVECLVERYGTPGW